MYISPIHGLVCMKLGSVQLSGTPLCRVASTQVGKAQVRRLRKKGALMGVLLQGFYKLRPNRAIPSPADGDPETPWWWDHMAAQANDFLRARPATELGASVDANHDRGNQVRT
jgi:hypothetical protein